MLTLLKNQKNGGGGRGGTEKLKKYVFEEAKYKVSRVKMSEGVLSP